MGRGQVVVVGMVGGRPQRAGGSAPTSMRRGGTMQKRTEITVLRRVGARTAERLGQPGGIGPIKGKTPEQIAEQVAKLASANRTPGAGASPKALLAQSAQLATTGKVMGGKTARGKARSRALAGVARDSFSSTQRGARKQRAAGRIATAKKTRQRQQKSARQRERRAEQRAANTPEVQARRERRNEMQRRRRAAARQAAAAAAG